MTPAQIEALNDLAAAVDRCRKAGVEFSYGDDGIWLIGLGRLRHIEYLDTTLIRALLPKHVVITAATVAELQKRTGEGLALCRVALIVHHGDMEGAIEHLRCEGQAVVRSPGSLQPCGCPIPKHNGS